MAKQRDDRTTIELFDKIPQRGRPRTNPLQRKDQLRVNKKNQVKRDKAAGLKRVELKLHQEAVVQLDQLAFEVGLSRAEYVSQLIQSHLMRSD